MKSPVLLFSACACLIAAFAVIIHGHGKERKAIELGHHAESHAATNRPNTRLESRRSRSKEHFQQSHRAEQDEDLVAKYGATRTKLARKVTGDLLNMVEGVFETLDLTSMLVGVADTGGILEQMDVRVHMGDIMDQLAMDMPQTAAVAKVLKSHEQRRLEESKEAFQVLRSNPRPVMELLLAGDATANGMMERAEFDRLRDTMDADLTSELGIAESGSSDPLRDPSVQRELNGIFSSGQREIFQGYLASRPEIKTPAGTEMPFDITEPIGLDELDRKLESTNKLTTGLKSLIEGLGELTEEQN